MKRLTKYNVKPFHLLVMLLCVAGSSSIRAQQIMIDRGVRAGDLWCFPLLTDSLVYLYLPSDARLGTDNNGQPQFSFLR